MWNRRSQAPPRWDPPSARTAPPPIPPMRGSRPRGRSRLLIGLIVVAVLAMVTCGALGSALRPGWLTLPWFGPTHAPLDALSADLAAYAKSQGDDMGVVVYDITHNRYYSYNENTPFLLASSAKTPIMLSYLDLVESQNRQPTASEKQLLTRMITVSDNDAAQALYQARGWNAGQAQYLQKIGVSGYQPNPNGWGWATLPPAGMAQLLTMLYQGKILNAQDRALAMSLLGSVDQGQRWGVGQAAPDGASVYMKDGWVAAPDGSWAMNSSGIVESGGETYLLSVYTQHQPGYSWTKVQRAADLATQALT
jgi:beta-lactamase class A